MHVCPSVDIIVYDITRGSMVLPGNKAYHQLKKNPHKASSPRGFHMLVRAARSSLYSRSTDSRYYMATANLAFFLKLKKNFFMPNYRASFLLWNRGIFF